MKSRRILCMTALMLAMLLAMGGCKQAEAKEASTQPVEQVEETEETTEEPTIGESTEEELKAEAEAKAKAEAEAAAKAEAEKKAAEEAAAKAEAEKKAAEEAAAKAEAEKKAAEELKAKEAAEAAAKAEAEKKAAEEAAKTEKETVTAQAETTTSGDGAVEAATPAADTASSGGYTLNEYGNPVDEMVVRNGLVDTINVTDPRFQNWTTNAGYHGSVPIPNPMAKVEPISPFIGMKNPPDGWENPIKYTGGSGDYKWDSETGSWRYYNGNGEATKYYVSMYGVKTTRSSETKRLIGEAAYNDYYANCRGVY